MGVNTTSNLGGSLSGVEQAVRHASSVTGIDFGFLMRTARRESGLDANARAGTSSAAGLFQFVEQTWLSTLKRHGAAHGYARYADQIEMGSDGRFRVGNDEARRAVMDLRFDPHCAATMAGELASDHASYLRGRVGREPTGGELYAAHFLGPQGCAKLIEAKAVSPNAAAAPLFPDAAAANRGVFYHDGRALTVAEVFDNLNRTGGADGAVGSPTGDPGEGAFIAYAGAGRMERMRQQALLVQFLLGDDKTGSGGPVRSLFSADMLSALQDGQAGR